MSKKKYSIGALTMSLPFLVWGCGGADGGWDVSEEDPASGAPEEGVGSVDEALSKSTWCKVVDTLVELADAATDVDVDSSCNVRAAKELYYFGSSPPDDSSSGMPRRTAIGLYCALDGSNDAKNTATLNTRVGKFGTRSRFRVTKRDSGDHKVTGQLIGDTYLFGVGFPLSVQDLSWNYNREIQEEVWAASQVGVWPLIINTTQLLPNHIGYYGDVAGEGIDFDFNASATFTVGPVPVTVKVNFDHDSRQSPYRNNGFTTSPAAEFKYSSVEEHSLQEQLGHALLCSGGCDEGYFRDLGDAILPYSGPFGGARADYLYRAPNVNSWQLGYPDGTKAYSGEPRFTLAPRSGYTPEHTTEFRVEVIGTYSAKGASVKAGVVVDHKNRNGMAIREKEFPEGISHEFLSETQVWTELSAETAIGVTAWIQISVPLLGTYRRSFEIVDAESEGSAKPSSVKGVTIGWITDRTGPDNTYNAYVKGSKSQDPDDAIEACLDSANDQSRSRTSGTTGKAFMESVHEPARENVYPCNVKICVPTGEGATGGRLTTCEWVASKKDLACTETGNSCNVKDTKADMCDTDGDVIPGKTTCQACRTNAHCGGGGLICHNGCCEPEPT